MRMALYQPDIAGNTGTIIRLCACFGVALDIIEPCGFPFSDKQLKRSAMDYAYAAQVERRPNFSTFTQAMKQGGHRLVPLTHRGDVRMPAAVSQVNDVLMMRSAAATREGKEGVKT